MAPSIDEFDDLTKFADESFDTDEVDLFEFADDEDSPLLRLKSIVLSLDWDITEETLAELTEELTNLRAMWKGDKVAQIYLQGMENVGKYLQAEGAYAHPNAIKLLLTLYHNYEKIISSTKISGEAITAMLKADIRKFKVLQYQISMFKSSREDVAEVVEDYAATPTPERDEIDASPLKSMEATILGLEWEVTDEGLEKFHNEASELRKHLGGNPDAQVLVQGLQALGSYIREQKTDAHPDSFTILHSFYDALKLLLEHKEIGAEQRRQILIEQISSLNSLKAAIARAAEEEQHAAEAAEHDFVEEEAAALAAAEFDQAELGEKSSVQETEEEVHEDKDDLNLDRLFDEPAGGGVPVSLPNDDDDQDDELFSTGSGATVLPALADEDEESDDLASAGGISADRAAELDEKLDSFFNIADEGTGGPVIAPTSSGIDDASPAASPLADDEDGGFSLSGDDEHEEDFDSFFNFDDDAEAPQKQGAGKLAAVVLDDGEDEETSDGGLDDKSDHEIDSFFNFEDDAGVPQNATAENDDDLFDVRPDNSQDPGTAALMDDSEKDDKATFAPTSSEELGLDVERAAEINEKLDSFFNFDDEQDVSSAAEAAKKNLEATEDHLQHGSFDPFLALEDNSPLAENQPAETKKDEDIQELDDELITSLDDDGDERIDIDERRIKTALEDGSNESVLAGSSQDDEDDEFGSFFSLDKEQADGSRQDGRIAPALEDEDGSAEPALDGSSQDDELDSFFAFDEEHADGSRQDGRIAPALEDEDGSAEPALAGSSQDDEDDEFGSFFSLDKEQADGSRQDGRIAPALEDEDGSAEPALDGSSQDDELDSFFALDEEQADGSRQDGRIAPALEDEDGSAEPALDGSSQDDEDDEFGSFFSLDEEQADGSRQDGRIAPALEGENGNAEPTLAGSSQDDEFDSFFALDEKQAAAKDNELLLDVSAEKQDEAEEEKFDPFAMSSDEDDSLKSFDMSDKEEDDFFRFDSAVDDDKSSLGFAGESQSEALATAGEEDNAFFSLGEEFVLGPDIEAATHEEADSSFSDDLVLEQEFETKLAADGDATNSSVNNDAPDFFFESGDAPVSSFGPSESAGAERIPGPAATSAAYSLAAAISALDSDSAPLTESLKRISELATAARKEEEYSFRPLRTILLTLLDSSASLLVKAPGEASAAYCNILKELVAELEIQDPAMLAKLISRYAAWQQEFFATMMIVRSDASIVWQKKDKDAVDSVEEMGLKLVQAGFSRLIKEAMTEEFNQLRKELIESRSS